jgi:hypothetical protein
MQVRVVDMQGFDESLTIPDNFTVSDLQDLIHLSFQYDVSSVTFYHNGHELSPDLPLSACQFTTSAPIVLFNSRIFPQKSYPKVDLAFRFFPSRYQEFAFNASFADGQEPSARAQPESPGAIIREVRRQLLNTGGNYEALSAFLGDSVFEDSPELGEWVVPEPVQRLPIVPQRGQRRQRTRLLVEDQRAAYGVPDDVELSGADFQALRRLEASGVDRPTIASVYIACDRNEAMAQNCLMSLG